MYGLKMGLNGFAANTPDVVELLANSFNTFTNTSFDVLAEHRFGIIIKSKSLPWRTCQPVAPGCS
jgi:hypothetical protein